MELNFKSLYNFFLFKFAFFDITQSFGRDSACNTRYTQSDYDNLINFQTCITVVINKIYGKTMLS